MRKLFFMLIIVSVAFTSCKKDKPQRKAKKLPTDFYGTYYSNGNINFRLETHYTYDEKNNIVYFTRNYNYIDGSSSLFRYEFSYADAEKGLPEKYDKYLDNALIGHRLFFFTDERLTRIEDWNAGMDTLKYSYDFTYDGNGKVTSIRYINPLRNRDNTDLLTFNGDNLTLIKSFQTRDMQNPQREYFYEDYDDHPIASKYVHTRLWPSIRKNNYRHYKRIRYSNGQATTTEKFYELEYDDDGYPVTITAKNPNGEILYQTHIEYNKTE